MKKVLFILTLIIPFVLEASILTINNESSTIVDEAELLVRFNKAQDLFEKELGPVLSPIELSIQDGNCFRTGFDFIKDKVVFCKNIEVKDYGLKSLDVFNHELFHAFLCHQRPELCNGIMRVDVHEGLADYFSYLLSPDQNFGENFYLHRDYIRQYKTNWRQGLVQGDHAKGNVIARQLIESHSSLKDALKLFYQEPSRDEVQEVIEGAPISKLNRYRLKLGQEIKIDFQFAQASEVSKVFWQYPKGISVQRPNFKSAIIKFTEVIPTITMDAVFYSSSGEELGFRHYYFGLTK